MEKEVKKKNKVDEVKDNKTVVKKKKKRSGGEFFRVYQVY